MKEECKCREGEECKCGNECHCGNECKCGCGCGCGKNDGCGCKKGCKALMGLVLAAGIAFGGFFPGYYYYRAKTDANSVTVKGLAEMSVKADLAVWNLKFVATGDNLQALQQQMSKQAALIGEFLQQMGIAADEINYGRIETNDLLANPYRSGSLDGARFILNQTVTVKSRNVDLIAAALAESNSLIAKGIVFDGSGEYAVSYIFTKLNEIKPQMLKEATANAKEAALEFARNSGSKVGAIRHANQGVFSILPGVQTGSSMESQQIDKTVRVVSTVEYWLK